MDHRTRGFVIALASSAAGGLLPVAVSAQMIGTYLTAAGLGTLVLLNAAIAFIHILEPAGSDRARDDDTKADGRKTDSYSLRVVNPAEAS